MHPAPHRISRRSMLRGAAATLVIVTGGTVYRAIDQGVFSTGQGPAYAPWTTWRSAAAEGPLALVRAGILAANPHNTQPWLFRVSDNRIDLYADTRRNLGTMDPYLREMHIGLGCALENMTLAAQALGYTPQLTLHPRTFTLLTTPPGPTLVATLALSPATVQPSPLYEAIPHRHTDRAPYDAARSVAPETAEYMRRLVDAAQVKLFVFTRGEASYARLVDETIAATAWIIADAQMSHDSHAWFVASWQNLQHDKDGPYIDTAGISPLLRAMVKVLPPMDEHTDNDGWLSGTHTNVPTSALVGLIAVRDQYDAPQTLVAGQAWQRLHLWATTQSLSMQPINQVLEVVDRERQLGQEPQGARILDQITGAPQWRPTFAFRLGYPTQQVLPSARRPVEDVQI